MSSDSVELEETVDVVVPLFPEEPVDPAASGVVQTPEEAQRMVALHLRAEFPTMYVGEAVQMGEGQWDVFFRVGGVDHMAEVSGYSPEETRLVEDI